MRRARGLASSQRRGSSRGRVWATTRADRSTSRSRPHSARVASGVRVSKASTTTVPASSARAAHGCRQPAIPSTTPSAARCTRWRGVPSVPCGVSVRWAQRPGSGASSNIRCIIRRRCPRRRWVARTPVEVTPPIGSCRPPGTVISKVSIAEAPTHRPPSNAPTGWKVSSAASWSARSSSCSRVQGVAGGGHGSGPPCQAAGAGSQCGGPVAIGRQR